MTTTKYTKFVGVIVVDKENKKAWETIKAEFDADSYDEEKGILLRIHKGNSRTTEKGAQKSIQSGLAFWNLGKCAKVIKVEKLEMSLEDYKNKNSTNFTDLMGIVK